MPPELFFPYIKKFLDWISLKKITLLGAGVIVMSISLSLFESRDIIVNILQRNRLILAAEPHDNLQLDANIKDQIRYITHVNPDVSFIMVVGAYISRNEREIVFWSTNDPELEFEIRSHINTHGVTSTLLGRDEETNVAIIRAINGDFACFDNTRSLIVQSLNKNTARICRVSIPPYYGQFSGYITFGLTKNDISPDRFAVLRRQAVELASNIYFSNVNRMGRL